LSNHFPEIICEVCFTFKIDFFFATRLPCLHVGNPNKFTYLPLEFLSLKKQACPQTKKLRDDETASMIRFTAVPPAERQKRIMENLRNMNDSFKKDPYATAFDITIDSQMTKISGRVLDPPVLGYKFSTILVINYMLKRLERQRGRILLQCLHIFNYLKSINVTIHLKFFIT